MWPKGVLWINVWNHWSSDFLCKEKLFIEFYCYIYAYVLAINNKWIIILVLILVLVKLRNLFSVIESRRNLDYFLKCFVFPHCTDSARSSAVLRTETKAARGEEKEARSSWRREDSVEHTHSSSSLSFAQCKYHLRQMCADALDASVQHHRSLQYLYWLIQTFLLFMLVLCDIILGLQHSIILRGVLNTPPILNLTSGFDTDSWRQFLSGKHITEDPHIVKVLTLPREGRNGVVERTP